MIFYKTVDKQDSMVDAQLLKNIEIFKTDVTDPVHATAITCRLLYVFPSARINFDLDDCDKVLRIEIMGIIVDPEIVIHIVSGMGNSCEPLI